MPSHILASLNPTQCLPHKKIIRKLPQNTHQHCKNVPEDTDSTEENTMSETTQAQSEVDFTHNLQRVARLVKFANLRFKYSLDTYLACLCILSNLRLEIPESKIKLLAAAVLLIAGKVHEFRTPKFLDLLRWGEHQFRGADLIKAEGELLVLMDFKVPVAFKCSNMRAIEQQIEALEAKIHAQPFLFQ